jgi:hypothetical protein
MEPTGAPLATSVSIDTTTIDGTFQVRTFTFDGSVELAADTRYALITKVSGGGYITCKGETVSGYSPGMAVDSDDGSIWNDLGADLYFAVSGRYLINIGGNLPTDDYLLESWGF